MSDRRAPSVYDVALLTTAGLLSFLAMAEMGIGTVIAPVAAADLGQAESISAASVPLAQFVVLAYQIPLVVALLPAGRLIDAVPVRRVLLGALVVVGASGPLAALTPPGSAGLASLGVIWFGAVRIAQGVGAAALLVLMPVLATLAAPPERRARALAVTATLGPIGAAAGPVIGGLLVDAAGWRVALLAKVPLALVAAVLARRSLDAHRRRPVPPGGRAPAGATSRPRLPYALLAATATMAAAIQGTQFTLSVTLQGAGFAPRRVALVLLVLVAAMAATGRLAGRLADAHGPRRVSLAGALLTAAGLAWLVLAPTVGVPGLPGPAAVGSGGTALAALPLFLLLPGLVVAGVGAGLYGGPTQAWVMGEAPPGRMAGTAAAMQLARAGGFALGPLLAGAVLAVAVAPASSLNVALALCLVAAVLFAGHRHPRTAT